MSHELEASVVHEAEAQRQHPRVRIPATLHVDARGRSRAYRVLDVSLGGFAFRCRSRSPCAISTAPAAASAASSRISTGARRRCCAI